ncbi:MAG TPA: hypothetical protein IAB62_03575 [Candidatus Coprocola pullicola]|nr:hypothetical protein [Candidatus Coprocola pullicola]
MKRILACFLTTIGVLSFAMTPAFAANLTTGRNFVDVNENGICDYMENAYYDINTDNNGIYGYNNVSQSYGRYNRNFVDADRDGVCDYYSIYKGVGAGNGFRGGCCNR